MSSFSIVGGSDGSNNIVEEGAKAITALGGTDLSVAEEASKFIENAVRYDRAFFLIDEVQRASHKHNQGSPTYMRYINLLCRISTFGDEEFRACEKAGAVRDICTQCMTDDILVQINVIGLLTEIGSTVSGLDFMCDKGVFDWLIWVSCGAVVESTDSTKTMNTDTDLEITDPMIRIESLRVLGSLFAKSAAVGFNVFGRLHHTFILHFLQTIHRYLDERNEEERLTGN